MDVDRFSLSSQFLDMLEALAKAHFVAFDLELSGIQSRQSSSTGSTATPHEGKHTLQQRYEELKSAAEKYQVLQVGLTCVEEDIVTGTLKHFYLMTLLYSHISGIYTLRPYNLYLNPVLEDRLGVQRIFSYQSGGWLPGLLIYLAKTD